MTNQQPIQVTPKFNAKQKQAMRLLVDHNNGVNEICFGGGAGGGKSYLGCLWLITCAFKYPGTRWLVGGKELKKLKQTTIKSFFEVAKLLQLQEGHHFKYSEIKSEIKFQNGSEILILDLDNQLSDPEFEFLGSIEVAGAFIDESSRISEKAKNMVMSRIRHKLDEFNIIPKLLLTCNPHRGWLYNQFYKKHLDGTLESYKAFIQSLTSDNEFISKHYINSLNRLDSITKARLLYGSWEYQDELAMFNYDALIDMFNPFPDLENEEKTILSIDVAHLGKDKTCIIVWKGLNVVEIVELSKSTFPEQKATIEVLMYKYNVKVNDIVMDLDGLSAGLYDMFPGCMGIHNNSKALNGDDFQNLKTQLYFKLADLINTNQIKIRCNEDHQMRLTQELQIIKREKVDSDGKIQMTNKDTVRKLIGRSPDISDAMAFRMYWIIKESQFDYGFFVM